MSNLFAIPLQLSSLSLCKEVCERVNGAAFKNKTDFRPRWCIGSIFSVADSDTMPKLFPCAARVLVPFSCDLDSGETHIKTKATQA